MKPKGLYDPEIVKMLCDYKIGEAKSHNTALGYNGAREGFIDTEQLEQLIEMIRFNDYSNIPKGWEDDYDRLCCENKRMKAIQAFEKLVNEKYPEISASLMIYKHAVTGQSGDCE